MGSEEIVGLSKENKLLRRKLERGMQRQLILEAFNDNQRFLFRKLQTDYREAMGMLEEAQQKVHDMATFDKLTGLANRAYFYERLQQEVRSASSERVLALAFVDLDKFKLVNDNYGHSAGDAVLVETGRRLAGSVRALDLPVRIGGDEFAIILPNAGGSLYCGKIGERIVEKFAVPVEFEGKSIIVRPSVGFAICTQAGTDPDQLVSVADGAMYDAKRAGGNQYIIRQL